MTQTSKTQTPKIVIIGAGFGGICMGYHLRKAGITDFIIVEKASSLGGTWRENTYPGAECDVPSALYSFSFAPNPTWDFKWARQPQILDYMQKTADELCITPHMQFNETALSAAYDATAKHWTVTTDKGVYNCQFFISALGQLHRPRIPDFKGKDSFKGSAFHSAQWNHDLDLSHKRIAVIGSAASAIQFIPEIAKIATSVDVYQRSPNWIIPKIDRPATRFEKTFAKLIPWWSQVRRAQLWASGEYGIWPIIKGARIQSAAMKALSQYHMRKSIKDKAMQKILTPDFPIGAKRILFSDHYYEALARDTVALRTHGVKEITQDGLIDGNGGAHKYDVIIYGTGFHSNPFLQSISVTGTNGQSLREHWKEGAFAYLGITTHGFPNMLMLYGPNTNTGHTSIIYKLECQARYVVQFMKAAGDGTLDVRDDVETTFNIEVQNRLEKLAWNQVEASWYKDCHKITNNWMGSSLEYRRRTRQFNLKDYI